jgi:hypothetical protein
MNSQSPAWAPVIAAGIVALGAFLGNLLSLVGIWLVQAKTSQRDRDAKDSWTVTDSTIALIWQGL